jgi:hypothetical protein
MMRSGKKNPYKRATKKLAKNKNQIQRKNKLRGYFENLKGQA